MQLPMTMEEVTAPWLQQALSPRWPGIVVHAVKRDNFSHGAATRARLILDYEWTGSGAPPPPTMWLKTGFEAHHDFAMPNYIVEVDFYAKIRRHLKVRSPECYFAGLQEKPAQATLLLEDLVARGATFCKATHPLTPDQVATGLRQLALLHSQPLSAPEMSGLVPIHAVHYATTDRGTKTARYFEWTRAFAGPVCLLDAERIRAGFEVYWKMIFGGPRALVHGDSHVGNSYIDADGQVCFLDWQGYGTGYWMQDVPYFLIGALDLPDRRACERDLFRYYLGEREKLGAKMPAFDDVWDDYRRAVYFGFITWIGNEDTWQPPAVNMAQYARFAVAMIDHDTFRVLGV
jgi:Phosphotransferase enzyme family